MTVSCLDNMIVVM